VCVTASFEQPVQVSPGNRLLTAAILAPMASTLAFSQYRVPAGTSDHYRSRTRKR
jgi:hypothetical protein